MSASNEENRERPMTPPTTPLLMETGNTTPLTTPEQPSKKRKFNDILHAISYSSTSNNGKEEAPLSPMKDWNMFYDGEGKARYQNLLGDELSIRDKIHDEIEIFIRGDEDLALFWKTIDEIRDIHEKNIENLSKYYDVESFTTDELFVVFNDYFDDVMDKAMKEQKETVLDKSNRTISESERKETLNDVERYFMLKDNIDDVIKKHNVEKKGETTGGRRKRTKKNKSKRKQKYSRKNKKKRSNTASKNINRVKYKINK